MARERVKKKAKAQRRKHEFCDLPVAQLVEDVVDLVGLKPDEASKVLASGPNLTGLSVFDNLERRENVIFRLHLKYAAGQEAVADEVEKRVAERVRGLVLHMMPTRRTVVGTRAVRAPDIVGESPTVHAMLRGWMKRNPPIGVDEKVVVKRFREAVQAVSRDGAGHLFEPLQARPHVLRRLEVEGYGPFAGSSGLTLPKGSCAVVARYVGQEGRSNRAGKSKLLDAVRFAWFGTGGKDDIHEGMKRATVVVTSDVDSEVLSVRREIPRKVGVNFEGHQIESKNADAAIVEALGGVSKEDFERVAFVSEDDLHGLLKRGHTDAKVKQDLARWFGLAGWGALRDEFKRGADGIDVDRIERDIEREEGNLVDNAELNREIEEVKAAIEKLRARAGTEAERELELGRLHERLRVSKELHAAKNAISEYAEVKSIRVEKKTVVEKLRKKWQKKHDTLMVAKSRLEDAESNLVGFDGECPVDGATCPRKAEINGDVKARKAVVDEWKRKHAKVLRVRDDVKCMLDDAEDNLDAVDERWSTLKKAKQLLDEHGAEAENIKELEAEIARLGKPDKDAARFLEERRGELADLEHRLKLHLGAEKNLKGLRENLEIRQRALSIERYLERACGPRGIPSLAMEALAGEVESGANEILADIGCGLALRLEFEEELKKLEPQCPRCGHVDGTATRKTCSGCGAERPRARRDVFNAVVVEGAREHRFERDSQGGKTLVALALRMALARKLGFAVLFLDEVCGSLDDMNLEAFARMVRNIAKYGLRQVFVISHRNGVADKLPHRIVVTRDGAESAVEREL